MANYVFLYSGGSIAETPEAQEKSMAEWTSWFGELGESVTDGGAPFGAAASVTPDGTANGGSLNASGYTLISATSLEDATAKAKGCPVLATGGSVDVYEAIQM